MPRFLLISPDFPPSERLGAKRGANLAAYLPAEGWQPIVLSGPAPGAAEGRAAGVETPVHRAFTSPLGRFLRWIASSGPPRHSAPTAKAGDALGTPAAAPASDAQGSEERSLIKSEISPLDQYLWDLPWVVPAAVDLARREHVNAVAVNADPWSGLVVGAAVARRLALPFLADMRDPWALHPLKAPRRPALTQRVIVSLERRLLARADRVVLNTERCAAAYRAHYAGVIEAERFSFVRNAFDPAIAETSVPPSTSREAGTPFAVHYFGTIDKGRDPLPFYRGFEQFVRAHGLEGDEARIVFYGAASAAGDPRVSSLGLGEFVEVRPKASLRQGIAQLRGADVLLLLEGPERSLQLPAKLYDYFAAGRPILAVGANDELRGILESTGAGCSTSVAAGPEAVAAQLAELYRARTSTREAVADVSAFDARAQAARYREELEAAVRHHHAGRKRVA